MSTEQPLAGVKQSTEQIVDRDFIAMGICSLKTSCRWIGVRNCGPIWTGHWRTIRMD